MLPQKLLYPSPKAVQVYWPNGPQRQGPHSSIVRQAGTATAFATCMLVLRMGAGSITAAVTRVSRHTSNSSTSKRSSSTACCLCYSVAQPGQRVLQGTRERLLLLLLRLSGAGCQLLGRCGRQHSCCSC